MHWHNVNEPIVLVLNGLFVAFENYFLTFLCTGNHWKMGDCLPTFGVTGYLHFSIQCLIESANRLVFTLQPVTSSKLISLVLFQLELITNFKICLRMSTYHKVTFHSKTTEQYTLLFSSELQLLENQPCQVVRPYLYLYMTQLCIIVLSLYL